MARDRASIRLDMWADQDWRDLCGDAQHLYMLLLSHSTLSYAGVADWKPGRLAAMTKGKTAEDIERAAAELIAAFFIIIDQESEEVLVRSFIKHDGLLKQPKLTVSMTNAYAGIASRLIREVIAFEVQKAHEREPELNAWKVKQMQTLLAAKGVDIHTFTPSFTPRFTPDFTPAFTPNAGQAQGLPTSTTTSTATKRESTATRGTRLSEQWRPDEDLMAWTVTTASWIDASVEIQKFVNYWIAQPGQKGVKVNWPSTWRNWILRVKGDAPSDTSKTRKKFVAHAD